jgi:hypothetical protein
MALNRVDVWVEDVKGAKFTCAESMQESPVNNHAEEQAWRPLDTSQLLIVADFFPEYDYVNKTQQAQ